MCHLPRSARLSNVYLLNIAGVFCHESNVLTLTRLANVLQSYRGRSGDTTLLMVFNLVIPHYHQQHKSETEMMRDLFQVGSLRVTENIGRLLIREGHHAELRTLYPGLSRCCSKLANETQLANEAPAYRSIRWRMRAGFVDLSLEFKFG